MIKSQEEIETMRQSGRIVASVLKEMAKICRPGIKTIDLDRLAESLIIAKGAKPSFKGFKGYPYATCISLNEEVVHGLPSHRLIKEGDLVGLDVGANLSGWHADAAISVGVGQISPQARQLLKTTQETLNLAISLSRPGAHLKDIQKEMQGLVEGASFSVVRDLSGHGIGKELQEKPEIANYLRPGQDIVLQSGMTFTYEPMVTQGDWHVRTKDDGWTVITADGSLSCHFEHTIAINKTGCEILTKTS